jgi:hypothetical protein
MDDVAEIILERTDPQIDGGRTELFFVSYMDEVCLDLIDGTIFWKSLVVKHQRADAPEVVLSGRKCVVGEGHLVVHFL